MKTKKQITLEKVIKDINESNEKYRQIAKNSKNVKGTRAKNS